MTRSNSRTCLLVVTAAMTAAGIFAGCGGEAASRDTAHVKKGGIAVPAAIKSAGKLSFCSDIAYPPMEAYEASEPVGFDVDLGHEIGDRLGVTAEFKNTGYDGIIAALQAGQCDAILSSMTVTPERSKQVTFVKYAQVGPAVLVEKGNPKNIHSVDDLGGKAVAVQVGTTDKAFLDQQNKRIAAAGGEAIQIQSFPKDTDAASSLRAGRVDAWVSDSPPIADYARKNPQLFEQVGGQLDAAPIGIAVRKDEGDLRRALAAAVSAGYDDGSIDRLITKWKLPNIALR